MKLITSSIEVSFDLDPVGLVGGEYESHPSVYSWCSFNPHRIMRDHVLNELTEIKGKQKQSINSPAIYTKSDFSHKFNSNGFCEWLNFGDDEEVEAEEADESPEFTVNQEDSLFQLAKPIAYDLSDMEFHANDALRTDASIWLKLMAISLFSGVPKIDENDRIFKKVERSVQVGVCQLQLYDLFLEAATKLNHTQEKPGDVTIMIDSSFVDPKLLNIEAMGMAQRYIKKHKIRLEQISPEIEQHIMESALIQSRKAIISATVTLRDFNLRAYHESRFSLPDLRTSTLNTYMNMRSNALKKQLKSHYGNDFQERLSSREQRAIMRGRAPYDPILYNSMPGMREILVGMDQVIRVYCHNLVPIDDQDCLYHAMNKNVEKLHLPQFVGEQGKTPVATYFSSSTPHTREYANKELQLREEELYDYEDNSEDHMELMLNASLRRHGMSRDRFITTIEDYFSERNKSEVASGLFITVLKVIADVGTFAANSIYYTADFRYQKLDKNTLELVKTARSRIARYKKVSLDSFDSNALNGAGSTGSDDCEGSAKVACTILEAMGHGRFKLNNQWKSTLLNSAKSVLDRLIIFPVGATVTSAYFSSDNKPIDMTKEANRQLPLIGDSIDKNSRCDGHCFGIIIIDAVVDQLLANGDLHPDQLRDLRSQWREEGIVFKKRDYTVPVIVLEGTGSVEPTVLPVDEVFDHEDRLIERTQARAEVDFLKTMKAKLNENEKENKDIMEMFSGEGVSFYTEKQDMNRRISRFYREIIHGVPIKLYRRNMIFSQVVFCKKKMRPSGCGLKSEFEYGVNTGELLRSGITMNKEIAIIAPFKESADLWQKKIMPMMESVQNQMPIMKLFHYSDAELQRGVYSRFLRNPNKLNDKTGTLIEALLESVAGNPELTVVRLQTREWKLADKKRVDRLNNFIMSFDNVVCHGMFSEKHIANCDALVDILLVVRV